MNESRRSKVLRLAGLAASVIAIGLAGAAAAGAAEPHCKQKLSASEYVVALNQIQNVMGRYAHLGEERGEGTLEELFAMKTEGVSWKTPFGPDGIAAVKARFARPAEDPRKVPGQLHMHAMFTPVIEIAADGKTALGVWDSFGPNIQSSAQGTGWLWVKYGVDFVQEDGEWKIWHLQVFPVFNAPYGTSITDNALEQAARAQLPVGGGGGPLGGGPNGPVRGDSGQNWTGPKDPLWIYDGKTPLRGPRIPLPYCSYEPSLSAAQYASY